METKQRPNHRLYIKVLRTMTAQQKLHKAFELSQFANQLFIQGLRRRKPHASEAEIRQL